MGWEEKIETLPSRVIWLIIFLCFFIPIAHPIGLPAYPISETTLILYNYLEALPQGSVVLMDASVGFANMPDSGVPMVAVMEHLTRLPVKVIYRPRIAESTLVLQKVQGDLNIANRKVYGVDYVNLPFVEGVESALLSFLSDIYASVQTDLYGTPIGDVPMMKDIHSGQDIKIAICTISGYADMEVRVYSVTNHIPLACLNFGGSGPYMEIYMNSGLMLTNLSGLRGGADYEKLISKPGVGIAALDALSLNYLSIFTLIVLGNIAYLRIRARKKGVT